jgi:cytochrome c
MFRSIGWILLVLAVGAGVHFALQGIIQSGDVEKRKGPDLSKLERLQASDPSRAATVRAGMEKYESICRLCHHRLGIGGKFTPPIAGRPEEWVMIMLKAYRAGKQMGPLTNLMAPWAAELSDEDIRNVAAYISTL